LGDLSAERRRKPLQPGRDVHRIAINVIAVDHDVPDVDAHAKIALTRPHEELQFWPAT